MDSETGPKEAAVNEDVLITSILSQLHALVSDHQFDLDRQQQQSKNVVCDIKGRIERIDVQIEQAEKEVSNLSKP